MTEAKIGIVGTGFIARHLAMLLDAHHPRFPVVSTLTRRPVDEVDFPLPHTLTRSVDEVIDRADVVVEVTGDPIHAAEVIEAAIDAGRPVVTMHTEFHVTVGSWFASKGLVTEAAGDQPGVLAELHEEAVSMGFRPVVWGNMKGFLDPDPTPESMAYWGQRQGISLPMVTSFTDGTKVQFEQVLVANGLGGTIAREGLLGPAVDSLEEAVAVLGAAAEELGAPIADFAVSSNLTHGVFIVARHDEVQADALRYYKLGDGPLYTLVRPNIFVHLEIPKTIARVVDQGRGLLDNSATPRAGMAAIAKRDLRPGERIERGIGSFDVRGHAIELADHPEHVPIGLLEDATVVRPVERGQIIVWDDVEMPRRRAHEMWDEIRSTI